MDNNNNQTNQIGGQSNTNMQNRPSNSRPISIQPSQATQLVQALKREVASAKAAGNDQVKAKQHYARAENIKQILLNYQAQQKAKLQQQQQQGAQNPTQNQPTNQNQQQFAGTNQSNFNAQSPGMNIPQNRQPSQTPQSQNSNISQPMTQTPAQPIHQSPSSDSNTPSFQSSNSNSNIATVENFNQVRARLGEFERRIQQLNENKRLDSTPEQVSAIERELTELKTKYTTYQKFAIHLKNQLVEQVNANSAMNSPQIGTPGSTQQDLRSRAQQQQLGSMVGSPSLSKGGPQSVATQQALDTKGNTPQSPGINRQGSTASPAVTNAPSTPNKSGQTMHGPPPINLTGITKPSVASLPISSSINVKPPTAITLKPNSNNNRATLSGGVANGIGSILGSPAITKLPTYELSASGPGGPIPDNGGRALTKRKLTELVNTIGVDEGDGKTNIDGDVEELLLDLADEFITSVTGFACRLAKHRKVDTIDVRDVQLHLERNWNIRIPGYAMDEIKATRKWQPSSSYMQKLSGVEISKSVNGNIN